MFASPLTPPPATFLRAHLLRQDFGPVPRNYAHKAVSSSSHSPTFSGELELYHSKIPSGRRISKRACSSIRPMPRLLQASRRVFAHTKNSMRPQNSAAFIGLIPLPPVRHPDGKVLAKRAKNGARRSQSASAPWQWTNNPVPHPLARASLSRTSERSEEADVS